MKESELRKHATCSICHQPVLVTGVPLFYRVVVERFGVDMRAVDRQDGLAKMLGSTRLASVMGPDPELARRAMEPVVLAVCERCSMNDLSVARLAEMEGVK